MAKKAKEWISVQVAKNPGAVVLAAILLFNLIFFIVSALVISNFAMSGTEKMNFIEAAFCTITMILDAGCVQFVIEDIGEANVVVAIICLLIIFIGMVSFTGAVIGYITNYISSFIENANTGTNKLSVSGHVVILNWNTRASEIVNDLIFCERPQTVVVLSSTQKEVIEKIINERLNDTIERENRILKEKLSSESFFKRHIEYSRQKLRNRLIVIVREGDVYSSKQLHDISIERAKTIIILGNDRIETKALLEDSIRGNSKTIKTLMQVADITSSSYSADNQKIIVEITDDWTWDVVDKVIKAKQVDSKCNIVPVRVNQILGQILSQFSLMPELNLTYRELFSNKGAAFYTKRCDMQEDEVFIRRNFANKLHAIPLTVMPGEKSAHCYFAAGSEKDIDRITHNIQSSDYKVKLNKNYWIEKKNIIILGHNSKLFEIMEGFKSFYSEWNYKDSEDQILEIVVIDDENSLKRMNNYEEYPFVVETVAASIYDQDIIISAIDSFMKKNNEDISILILSDDDVTNDEIDSNTLASLVYVQDIINKRISENPDFDPEYIDVIAEIIDPKHHDIVNSYSTNNVVISNRYISKMITQIGEKEALFDFYRDILTYDDASNDGAFESKEIYTKKVLRLFDEIPGECTADVFIRAVYEASVDESIPEAKRNPTIVLGYVKPGGNMVLFNGNQANIKVKLEPKDKLIVFSNH